MSVTGLNVYASGRAVGQQHRFYDVRGSAPTVGEVHEGPADWHVYRNGLRLPDESAYGVLDFSWVGIDGDVVRGRFIDRDGNKGEFVADTFSVTGTPILSIYVDSAAGSDAAAGTFAAPIQTAAEARTRASAALTTAGQCVITYFKRGGTYTFTAAGPIWDGNDKAFAHQVQFIAYGSGAKPILQASGGAATAFRSGPHGSLHLIGLEIDGVTFPTVGGSEAVNCQRNGPGARSPLDLLLDDVLIRNCTTGLVIEDNTITSDADLLDGRNDFVALRDVEMREIGNFAIYQDPGLRYVYRRRVLLHRQQPGVDTDRNLDRVTNWLHSFVFGCTWESRTGTGANGGARWQAGPGDGIAGPTVWRYCSVLDSTYSATNQNIAAWRIGRKSGDGFGAGTVADVRFVNCRTNSGKLAIGAEGGNGGNNVDRVQLWNCTIGGTIDIGYLSGGVVGSFEVRDCASSQAGATPLAHIRMLGGPARYAANSITITGHVGLHPDTAGNRALLDTGRCTAAEAAAIVSPNSNRNHVGRYGDGTVPFFVQGGFFPGPPSFYDLTLSQWRTERTTLNPSDTGDANSTATANSTLGVTAAGTSAANLDDFDPAYSSGAGPLDGLGSSRPYSLTADRKLRSSPSDPGPFQFGAVEIPDLPVVASAIAPIASWVTIGFLELTAGTLDVSVKAAALSAPLMGDGIASVDFAVSIDGVLDSTVAVTAPSLRYPNFTDEPSRMPGVVDGSLAPFHGYGFTFDVDDYDAGKVTIVATVTTGNGATSVLPTLTIYNHKAGSGLTMPSTAVVYLDFDSGDDDNDGSDWANAVLTAKRAQELARVDPLGSDLADKDAGGARIICRGTALGGSEAGAVDIHTTEGWLTFEADDAGCQWSRLDPPSYTAGTDTVYAGAGTGTACRIRFKGFDFVGAGPVIQVGTGCTATAWQDGGTHYSRGWSSPASWSVCYSEDEGPALSFDGGAGARRYATGVDRGGCVHGFAGYSLVYDCDIHEFLGIAVQFVGTETPSTAGAIRLRNQRYTPGTVRGYLRMDGNTGAGGTASPSLVASVTLPGVLRITGPVGGYDFGTPASGLLGSALWGIKVTGLTAPNNGTWPFLRHGVEGGAYWLELQCPTATATSVGAGAASLVTAKLADGTTYYDAIHPDGLQIFGARDGDVVFDWVMESTPSMQSFFTSGLDQTRLLIENVRDDGSGLVLNLSGSTLTGCILRNVTNSGPLSSSDSLLLACEVTNCVFGSWSGAGSIGGLESRIEANHFISGFAFGASSTSGVWFSGTPTLPPSHSMEPRGIRIGTGIEVGGEPDPWAWNTTLPTRGVMRNAALDNWSPGALIGSVEVSLDVSMTGAASLQLVGAIASTLSITTEMLGTIGATPVAGDINCTLDVQMNGTGVLRVTGALASTMALSVAMVGRLGPEPILGAVAGSLSVSATMTGEVSTISADGLRDRIRSLLGFRTRTKRRPFWRRPWR